mgnify:CR=1 FL=1
MHGVRVLVVMPGLTPDAGAERSMAALLPMLEAGGTTVHVALLTARQTLVPVLERVGIVVHDLSGATSTAARARELGRVIAAVRPDLVHAVLFEAAVPAQIAARRAGLPVLVTWAVTLYDSGHFAEGRTRTAKLRLAQAVEIGLARAAGTRFHAVTSGVARVNAATLRVAPGRTAVGERGREAPNWTREDPPPERPTGLPTAGSIVLAVGRQEPQKDYGLLLEQFDVLADRRPDVHLVVAGRRGADSLLLHRQHRRMRHGDRVHFLGQRSDVPELVALADVVVCSSWREGAAGALIEAMAAGVPVVTVELDSLVGVVEDGVNGLVTPREHLAGTIAEILDDRALADRLGGAGRAVFEERFTLARSAERLAEIYEWAVTR